MRYNVKEYFQRCSFLFKWAANGHSFPQLQQLLASQCFFCVFEASKSFMCRAGNWLNQLPHAGLPIEATNCCTCVIAANWGIQLENTRLSCEATEFWFTCLFQSYIPKKSWRPSVKISIYSGKPCGSFQTALPMFYLRTTPLVVSYFHDFELHFYFTLSDVFHIETW